MWQSEIFQLQENLLPFAGEVFYFPGFCTEAESRLLMGRLQEEVPWRQEPIWLFGREILQPRLTAWMGEKAYSYSGITMTPAPFTPAVAEIKAKAEQLAGARFNSALLNLYRDGKDSMGWHRDNEKNLGPRPLIASVSFGAARLFQLRDHAGKKRRISIELQPGSLLLMRGQTQRCWEHRLPRVSQVPAPRINLTFRQVI